MKIFNLRFGFATNSSSTHSFIFLKGIQDYQPFEEGDFGWSFFTLASRKAKLEYLFSTTYQNIVEVSSKEIAQKVTRMLLDFEASTEGCIDHQSLICLPRTWGGLTPDEHFLRDFKRFLEENDDFVILGGNDNDDQDHPLANQGNPFILPIPIDSSFEWVCRWDPVYHYWTIFSRENGTKIRMSFGNLREAPRRTSRYEIGPDNVEKAFAPELVDLKITEVCTNQAPCRNYCYQNSGKDGKHCDFQRLELVARLLAELKVFEVALGGGDPMEHPDFTGILDLFWKYGVIPSFSTRKTDWLKNKEMSSEIFKYSGAVGFSVNTVEDIQFLEKVLKETNALKRTKIKLHYVMGSTPIEEFSRILDFLTSKESNLGTDWLLLLAFKKTGRGEIFRGYPYENCIELLMEKKVFHINADTAFLSEFQEEIREQCPDIFLNFQEGRFSCYIDPIKEIMAPSSFGGNEISFNPKEGVERFKELFASFP